MSRFASLKKGARQSAAVQCEDGYTRQPLFVGGMDGILITPIDVPCDGIFDWIGVHAATIRSAIDETGAVLLRGLPITSPEQFAKAFETLIGPTLSYHHRMTERSEVAEGNVYTSTDYPPAQVLPLHHEYSFHRRVIQAIAFYCVTPSHTGGATPLADGFAVYESIPEQIRRELEERDVLYVRNTGSPVTLSWQEAYQTEDKADVENYCRAEGINFHWRDDGELQTLMRQPATLDHPQLGKRILCNHIPLLHKSQAYTPALFERFFADTDGLDLPYHVLFGDGGEIPDTYVKCITDAYEQHANRFAWQARDILLLDNLRVAHGRDTFEGARKLNVVMSGLHDRTGAS